MCVCFVDSVNKVYVTFRSLERAIGVNCVVMERMKKNIMVWPRGENREKSV